MEKYFGNAYRGDPGVPHSGPDPFSNIWLGSFGFTTALWFDPYMWNISNQWNWHDHAMLFEQHQWKKARAKNKHYEFEWNKMPKEIRDSYYRLWPVYFK